MDDLEDQIEARWPTKPWPATVTHHIRMTRTDNGRIICATCDVYTSQDPAEVATDMENTYRDHGDLVHTTITQTGWEPADGYDVQGSTTWNVY